jgi:hypothetical protein
MRRFGRAACLVATLFFSLAAAPVWDPAPWLADLDQIRAAIERDYPNRDWLTGQLEVSLDRWFDRTADQIRKGHDNADARRALDGLIGRFDDGHVALHWPSSVSAEGGAASPSPPTVAAFCAARGYDDKQVTKGTAASLPGYRSIDGGGPFGAGVVDANGKTVGVIRIGLFSPQGYSSLCEQAVAQARTALDKPCDAACEDRLLTEASALMTRGLMTTVERLRSAGAQILLVDLSDNGGGTEWAEAAARIVSPISLRSAPIGVMRSGAGATRWHERVDKLRNEARRASPADRAMLLDLAGQADAIADGLKSCTGPDCPRLVRAGFASGLVAEMSAERLAGREWGRDIFSPAQFPYRDSVWKGPVIVLVDSGTWSAAEQFTALLRDNDAAIVMGGRTGGAGCGHIDGSTPIMLSHSRAMLELPNCARFRKDGSNEVSGIVPDVSTGVRWNDGAAYAGRLTAARLPEAVAQAESLTAVKDD